MQASYLWNKFYLHRTKIIFLLGVMLATHFVHAQRIRQIRLNNPNYDHRRMSYGFLIGIHTTTYQLKYSDKFVTPGFDSITAVVPSWSQGFSLGAILNYRFADFFDFRITPDFAFYEHRLTYLYAKDPSKEQLVETVMVELPLLIKYKSERRGNIRMYMLGGIKPAIEASGKRQITNTTSKGIDIKGKNLSLELGFGFDLYYPLFKFSPEIRFSRGIMNILDKTSNPYSDPLSRINTNTITVFLLFQ